MVFVLIVAAAYGLTHVLSGRAAYIHVGALIGTIMVGNVLMLIIPGQRKMVEAMSAGRMPRLSKAPPSSVWAVPFLDPVITKLNEKGLR